MAFTLNLERNSERSLVEQIVAGLTTAIANRALRAGDALPSVRQLAREQGLSAFTVSEAYQRLVASGQVVGKRGASYRVVDKREALPSSTPEWSAPSLNAAWLLSDVFADHSVPIKAGCGWIPGEWINESGLQHALRALSRVPGARFGGYGHPFGMASLREQIAARLRRNDIPVESSNVLLTQGATQALDLVVRTLLRPGDTVIVEDPCYCNLLQILQLAGLKVVGLPRSTEGHDLDQLSQLIKRARPKAIFVNTVLQNPSGTTLSLSHARRLLEIADQHGLWVIEDDIYRELAPEGAPCLAALEGLERVIYISGFSKTITPTLRVGYVAAHGDILASLARSKMAVGLTSSEVTERIVANVLTEGHYQQHLNFLTDKLKQSHQRVGASMRAAGVEIFEQPEAGLFLWGRLPIDAKQSTSVATRALKHGIWLAPGAYFRPEDRVSNWFRFNVANSDHPVLWDFIRTLV
ncbi:MAG: PLP-dependent aminotransferase family protein [Alcaligenaceae bacterium]